MNKRSSPTTPGSNILLDYVAEAIEQGFDALTVEYQNGEEVVYAQNKGVGVSIASLKSSSKEAAALRHELLRLTKGPKIIRLWDKAYVLKARIFDSFGEDAFRVMIKPAEAD